ncbi:Phospholipase D delta [Vitis vinifera]|uniref:Phospholipase D delta n=1 Tax=Vitis vinifera TaxID=29760 RepID=A0A438GUT9_VITVI|nr:Phospholipase D delta [Vitis vinifera]
MAGDSTVHQETPVNVVEVSGEAIFLHGELDLWILEAKALPNMDLATERVRRCFHMFGSCTSPFKIRHKHSSKHHSIITSDPYVSVCLAGATIAQTRVIPNSENPSWGEHFCVPVAHPVMKVEFHVKDNDILGAQLIGPYPELRVSIQFRPVGENPLYKDGVGAGSGYLGVPNTYFPLHKGGQCWEEICHAMLEAHHLIYIIGWSIFHPVKLLREPTKPVPAGGELSLGELLRYKSEEGVRVLMKVSCKLMMKKHENFFKHSGVHCVLSPRYASNKLSIFKQQVWNNFLTFVI